MKTQVAGLLRFTTRKILTILKWLLILSAILVLALWGIRAFSILRAPPLQLWHTFVPQELTFQQMESGDWAQYVTRENLLFDQVRTEITEKLPPEARIQSNRFYQGSIVYPPRFANNWNRSYVLEPEGKPVGAVVLLHGLTDTPYSLRHIARQYRDQGFIAIGLRIPAHGTVPGALTNTTWEEWMAATRLAIREAKRRIEPDKPLHIVGFSNGGALAMKYGLDTLENGKLPKVDRLILLSPMIGITRFARFAGISGMPAMLPAFAKFAWLGIMPEFNPFKYNSFPVNGARQSYRLTAALQQQIVRLSQTESFNHLPPVMTFQSVMDYTVSTPAILHALYAYLPNNGSELVLFDINRAAIFNPLMRSASDIALTRMLPSFPLRYDLTVIGNRKTNDVMTVSRTTRAGTKEETSKELNIIYPPYIFSLSHVAIPFPMDDELYGMMPTPEGRTKYGINLGTLSARGERGALMVNLDSLFRTTSNPFFPYMLQRVSEAIDNPMPARTSLIKPTGKVTVAIPPAGYQKEIERFMTNETEEGYETP